MSNGTPQTMKIRERFASSGPGGRAGARAPRLSSKGSSMSLGSPRTREMGLFRVHLAWFVGYFEGGVICK